jgi:hypothetical protein
LRAVRAEVIRPKSAAVAVLTTAEVHPVVVLHAAFVEFSRFSASINPCIL